MVLMKLTTEGAKLTKAMAQHRDAARRLIEQAGGKVVADYVLFGRYDFLAIVDGIEDEKMLAATLVGLSRGTVRSETYRAFTFEEVEKVLKKL